MDQRPDGRQPASESDSLRGSPSAASVPPAAISLGGARSARPDDAPHGPRSLPGGDAVGGRRTLVAMATSPFLWGGLATAGFYGLVHAGVVAHPLVVRYFCGHPLEYVTAAFFFTGMATLAIKAVRLRAEYLVFRHPDVTAPSLPEGVDARGRAAWLAQRLEGLPAALRRTQLASRVRDVCRYVLGPRGAAGLEEHLKYLAELAADNVHRSYALVRTITWAVPILGFLGTVIGITLAIANVTPEQLESSLGEVTGGLAVAFDTTALSLALSMTLVFATFMVERAEQSVLADVERFAIRGPLNWFHESAARGGETLARMDEHLADLWAKRLSERLDRRLAAVDATAERVLQRWSALLDEQVRQWQERLANCAAEVLRQHAEQTAAAGGHWADELQRSLEGWRAAERDALSTIEASAQALREASETLPRRCAAAVEAAAEPWIEAVREGTRSTSENIERFAAVTETGLERLRALTGDHTEVLRTTAQTQRTLRESLERLTAAMERMGEESGAVARLEQQLAQNLATLRDTQTFEETLNSLSAAIQLLAARTRPHAA